jgi:predicted RNase H-like HicB family nuclease
MPNVGKFAVVLEPEDEGGFTARVPAFPEIVTYGKDEREALAMAEDAIRLVIEDADSYHLTEEQVAEVKRRIDDPNRKVLTLDEFNERLSRLIGD